MIKTTVLIAIIVILSSCARPIPDHEIGDRVIVNDSIKGTVVDVRYWTSGRYDYYVIVDGVGVWFDEDILKNTPE